MKRCSECGKIFATRKRYENHVEEHGYSDPLDLLSDLAAMEDLGLVEIVENGSVVRLTEPGRAYTALRAEVRAEGRNPDEDLEIRQEGHEFAVYDLKNSR